MIFESIFEEFKDLKFETASLDASKVQEYRNKIQDTDLKSFVGAILDNTYYISTSDICSSIIKNINLFLETNVSPFYIFCPDKLGSEYYFISQVLKETKIKENSLFNGFMHWNTILEKSGVILIIDDFALTGINIQNHIDCSNNCNNTNRILGYAIFVGFTSKPTYDFLRSYESWGTIFDIHILCDNKYQTFDEIFGAQLDYHMDPKDKFNKLIIPFFTDHKLPGFSCPNIYSLGMLDPQTEQKFGSLFSRAPNRDRITEIQTKYQEELDKYIFPNS